MIKLNDLIIESKIATVSDDIQLIVTLDKSVHAGERQSRHDNVTITEDDIVKTVKDALRKIGLGLIFDKFDVNDYIHIFNRRNNLNVVGVLNDNRNNTIEFKIITVMVKAGFRAKSGTYTINI